MQGVCGAHAGACKAHARGMRGACGRMRGHARRMQGVCGAHARGMRGACKAHARGMRPARLSPCFGLSKINKEPPPPGHCGPDPQSFRTTLYRLWLSTGLAVGKTQERGVCRVHLPHSPAPIARPHRPGLSKRA